MVYHREIFDANKHRRPDLFKGSGFRVQGSGFRVQGSGFRVQGSGFRVQGLGGTLRLVPARSAMKALTT